MFNPFLGCATRFTSTGYLKAHIAKTVIIHCDGCINQCTILTKEFFNSGGMEVLIDECGPAQNQKQRKHLPPWPLSRTHCTATVNYEKDSGFILDAGRCVHESGVFHAITFTVLNTDLNDILTTLRILLVIGIETETIQSRAGLVRVVLYRRGNQEDEAVWPTLQALLGLAVMLDVRGFPFRSLLVRVSSQQHQLPFHW